MKGAGPGPLEWPPQLLFRNATEIRVTCSKRFGVQDFRTYIQCTVPLNFLLLFLRTALIQILFFFFYMFFCAFNCIFLFSSLFIISNKKVSQGCLFFISYFYFFSASFSSFSKISSGVVEAKSFTTFSRDLPPLSKTTSLFLSSKTLER